MQRQGIGDKHLNLSSKNIVMFLGNKTVLFHTTLNPRSNVKYTPHC